LIVFGEERINNISTKLDLPSWWIVSVIVEHFPCRRFAENGKLWVFDFTIFPDRLISTIRKRQVVIPQYILFQNIRPKDLAYRAPKLMTGQSKFPLDNIDLVPEGIVNRSAFPFSGNSIDSWDPKVGFNEYAVVFDDGYFYQWRIAELYDINSKSSWYRSNLFDLLPLWKIYRGLTNYLNQDLENPTFASKKEIEKLYMELEKVRTPLRQEIWEYHVQQKTHYDTTKVNVSEPPLASIFDYIRVTSSGYETESHMEPLFYRAAIRNYSMAEEARKRQKDPESKDEAIIDEIEYSSMCIISATSCLESYINYIIQKYLPDESSIFDETSSHRQKWLWVPSALDLPFKFHITSPPYKLFSDLVQWRNKAIHHTPQFTKVKIHKSSSYKGSVSYTYSVFNLENAKVAIGAVRMMISKLSEGGKIPLPKWFTISPLYI
jgi:hypothetical protein